MMHLYPNRLAVGVKNTNTTTVMQITVAGASTATPGYPTWKPGHQLHTLQCIGDQVPLYAPGVPPVVEQECGPTLDPPQPASIDMMSLTTRETHHTARTST